MKYRFLLALLLFLLSFGLVTCIQSEINPPQQTSKNNTPLTLWWTKGFYPEEDEAIQKIVTQWKEKTGFKAELNLYDDDENLKKTLSALKAGNLPDIVYNRRVEFAVNPKVAWQDQLTDVTEIIEPIKNRYTSSSLQSIYLYNQATQQRSYYAIPIQQQTLHIHYWRDLLKKAGLNPEDIPQDWNRFWQFWQQAQDRLRQQGDEEIYGMGLAVSSESNDTFYEFEQILAANDIDLIDKNGKLQVNNPQVRQGIIQVLRWFSDFYKNGYVPVDAVDWVAEDNNVNFLNRRLLMILNPTLSIPASQKSDPEIYHNQIGTVNFPNEPDQDPSESLVSVKQVVTFKNSPHPQEAKNFLAFLAQPQTLNQYLQSSAGRYFPVIPELLSEPFWTDPNDPHIQVMVQQFKTTRPLSPIISAPYSQVFAENIWGKALERILVDQVSPEVATDKAIKRINEIFKEWQN